MITYLLLTQWSFSPLRKLKVLEALPFDAPYSFSYQNLSRTDLLPLSSVQTPAAYWEQVLDHIGILVLEDRQRLLAWPVGWEDEIRQLFVYDKSGIDLPIAKWAGDGQESTRYKGYDIYYLKDHLGKDIVVSSYQNLVLLSHQSVLIEDALRELTDQNQSTASQVDHPSQWAVKPLNGVTHSFFHFPFATPFFQTQTQQGLSYLAALNWEGWRIDWKLEHKNDEILNAVAFWKEGERLPVAKKTGLRMGAALEIIPAWAEDWELLQLRDVQQTNRQLQAGTTDWLDRYILPWAGDHIGWIDLMPTAEAISLAWLIPCRDSIVAQESLNDWLEEAGELNRNIYQTFELVQVNVENLFGAWRKGGELVQNPWWCKIADYYIFAADQQALRQLIDAYIVGQNLLQLTLPNDLLQLETQWLRALPCPPQWQALLPAESRSLWFSGSAKGKDWNIKAFAAKPSTETPKGPTVLWRIQVNAEVDQVPTIVPDVDQTWTVLTTDQAGNLYRHDQDGDLIWRKQLTGQRLSDIYCLPHQTANGYSFLLNTESNLYHLDATGQSVDNFPIRLQPVATAGVWPVDFQQEEIYEFFLPCENGIYAFSEQGVPLANWNPLAVSGRFEQRVHHLQGPTTDYLMAMNTAGVLYNWKRSGEAHFPPIQLTPTTNPLATQAIAGAFRVVAVDGQGLAQVINMEGEIFGLPLSIGSDSTVQFCSGNFIGDERMDLLTLSEDGLQLNYYSDKGFEKAFRRVLDQRPDQIFTVSVPGQALDYIGSLDESKREIRLYTGEGKPVLGFPLAGSTSFRIHPLDADGNFALVVGQGDWLLAYRIQL